ncbi:MAG: response regulator transcription factor [Eubacteriales bacterium]|nr:response regulator transcription factor [Eubacteriales bacterium]
MIKVLIVEDHKSMRDALRQMLEQSKEFEVVGEIPGANYALLYCERKKPDVVLMDICTEGNVSGLDATRMIRKELPDIKVVIMTAFDEVSFLPRARDAGAHAFIYKRRSLEYFSEVIRGVMEGKTFFPEAASITFPTGETPLTRREMDVLRCICKHMTNKEIAEELFISENTVKYHKSNMLAKTGFSNSVDLAFHMILNGWINPLL